MLNRIRLAVAFFLLMPVLSFASYTVVMRDGQRYRAKEKWTIVNGKAIFTLENGQSMSLDPKLIDQAESEKVNAQALGGARVLATSQAPPPTKTSASPLGSITIKPATGSTAATTRTPAAASTRSVAPSAVSTATGSTNLSNNVVQLFSQAYENVGLFDAKVVGNGANRLHITMTADNEDQVFKAISATAFMMTKVHGATQERVETIDLFLTTINGGSGGKFQMTLADATDLAEDTQNKWKDYFIRKVIF
ncbi:MAG: hypothetical protein NDJ92_01635 [Thermoanaerobaculia bacterium]|nr:hypothetical protein [Thermoanaerobaculia bacterium]